MIASALKDIKADWSTIPKGTIVNYDTYLDAKDGYRVVMRYLLNGVTKKYNCSRDFFEKNFK